MVYKTQADNPLTEYIQEHNVTYTKVWAMGMVKLDDGKILNLFERGTHAQNIYSDIMLHNSTDNGTTWGAEVLLKEHDGTYGYIPQDMIIAPNGNIIFHYLEWGSRTHSYMGQMHSTDNGLSWIDDGRVAGTTTYYGLVSNAITLSDGYTMVVALSECVSTSYDNSECIISTDNASSWTRSNQVPRPPGEDSVYEPTVVELSNGTLVMYCRSHGNGYLWKTFSEDKGINWCTAFASDVIAPSAPASLLRYSWSPSVILMAWDNSTVNRYPLNVSVSYDECETWVESTLLQDESLGNVAYPRFLDCTTDNGLIFLNAWIRTETYDDGMGYRFSMSWLNASFLLMTPEFISIDGGTNGTVIYTSTPTFNWTTITGAVMYNLQVARDSAFTDLVVNLSDINEYEYPAYYNENATRVSFTLPNANALPSRREYFCRVRALA